MNMIDPTGMDGEIVVTGRRGIPSILPLPPLPGTPGDDNARKQALKVERGLGRVLDWLCSYLCAEKPPEDAKDPNGAKAPGKPGEAEGFKDPKDGEKWGKAPNGKYGWVDDKGRVWVPTGQGTAAHGRGAEAG